MAGRRRTFTHAEQRSIRLPLVLAIVAAIVAVSGTGIWIATSASDADAAPPAIEAAAVELTVNDVAVPETAATLSSGPLERASVEAATAAESALPQAVVSVTSADTRPVDWVVRFAAPAVAGADGSPLPTDDISVAYLDTLHGGWAHQSLTDFVTTPPTVDLSGTHLGDGETATFALRFYVDEDAGDAYVGGTVSLKTDLVAVAVE